LGIPTVGDRVAQRAATLVLEPMFEADVHPCAYGFRPKRNATPALETLRRRGVRGGTQVLDADIRDDFGCIDQRKLMHRVERRISDRRVLRRLRHWLQAGVMEGGHVTATVAGTPHGGGRAGRATRASHLRASRAGTTPGPNEPGRPLARVRGRRPALALARAMQRIRQRVQTLTPRLVCHRDLRDTIAPLNPVLRGWGAYFRTGKAAITFGQLAASVNRGLEGR
jgi:hypothetical protein